MQAYSASFARFYGEHWGDFVEKIGGRLLDCYEQTPLGQTRRTLLDLCCGTGHLARLAARRGYRVIGLDLSEAMIDQARRTSASEVASGQVAFAVADATDFRLDEPVGLVTSTYDALNHLESFSALRRCFDCVFASLCDGGSFLFDLNTRKALSEWAGTKVHDTPDLALVLRGSFDSRVGRAELNLLGFSLRPDGLYERFAENVSNTAFDTAAVRDALVAVGWSRVYPASVDDLNKAADDPEEQRRVVFVAQKPFR